MVLRKLMKNYQEAINPQYKDPMILKMQNILTEMRNSNRDLTDAEYQEGCDRLSVLAKQRFGIPIKFIYKETSDGPCTITYSVIDESTGFDTISDFVGESPNIIAKLLQKLMYGEDLNARLNKASEAFSKFVKAGQGITIDAEKAYVTGLPENYDCVIYLNLDSIFSPSSEWYMDRDETLMGVILHEIGHVFSRLEFLYKTRRSVLAFEDVCRDIVKSKTNNGYKYVLTYKNVTGSDIDASKFKDSNVTVCYIGVIKDIGMRYLNSDDRKSSVDMEFVADQFASRFGYSEDLAKFLHGFAKKGYFDKSSSDSGGDLIVSSLIMSMSAVLFGCGLLGLFGIVVSLFGFLVISLILGLGMSIIFLFFSPITAAYDNVYDVPYIRIERMCLDVIRQIKLYSSKMSKDEQIRCVRSIDSLNKMLKSLKNMGYHTRGVNKSYIAEFLNKDLKNRRELVEFSEDLERNMENGLHVELARLKTL